MKTVLTTLNAKYIHTCLALRYLKAYAEHDFDMEIVEYTIKDPVMNIVSDLFQKQPDVIGFSCYIWNIEETIAVIGMLKKVMPQVRIVLGGPEVSYDTEYWMERIPEVDFIVVGEGEETFHHLLTELAGDEKFHFVFGLAYRKDGQVLMNPGRPKLDLNDIPSPHRFAEDIPQLATRVVYFETSRGCPFSCQFCLSSIEVGVRYFDIERTKADLLYLIESGAKLIKFVDRTFNIKRDYALEIFEFLIEHHQGCVFQFEITADIMRPEVLSYLAEHAPPGIFRFEIGVQSTNDLTNELIKRRQNFTKLSRTVTMIKDSDKIDQHLDLIAGLPEEDYDSFRKTFNDVFELRPEELQLGFLKMLRGTGLRHDAEKYGYIYMDQAPYEILGNDVMSFSDIVRIKRVEDVLEKYWNAHRMDHTLEYLIRHEFPSAFDFFQSFGDYWEERGWQKIGHQLEDLFVRLDGFLAEYGQHVLEGTSDLSVDDQRVLEGTPELSVDDQRGLEGTPELSLDAQRVLEGTSELSLDDQRVLGGTPDLSVDAQRLESTSELPRREHGLRHPKVASGLMKLDYFLNHKYKPRKIWWEFSLSKEQQGAIMKQLSEHPEEVSAEFAALGLSEKDLHKHTVVEVLDFDLSSYLAMAAGVETNADARVDGAADIEVGADVDGDDEPRRKADVETNVAVEAESSDHTAGGSPVKDVGTVAGVAMTETGAQLGEAVTKDGGTKTGGTMVDATATEGGVEYRKSLLIVFYPPEASAPPQYYTVQILEDCLKY